MRAEPKAFSIGGVQIPQFVCQAKSMLASAGSAHMCAAMSVAISVRYYACAPITVAACDMLLSTRFGSYILNSTATSLHVGPCYEIGAHYCLR